MMTLARTRHGKKIWIDWTYEPNGKITSIFQEFQLIEEIFDAWAVFEALLLRCELRNDTSMFRELYSDAESHYQDLVKVSGKLEIFQKQLGIVTSAGRLIYAREKLLNKEFLD